MFLERYSQIGALRQAYPMLSPKWILSRRYHLPIRAIVGSSDCILEVFVPLTYPCKAAEVRLLNPIPHMWANIDGIIRCPEWLQSAPLLSVVENVLCQFRDYSGYTKDSKNENNTMNLESLYESNSPNPDDLDDRIKEICQNPPLEAFPVLVEADNDDVEHLLSNEDEQVKLLYSSQQLSRLLSELARVLRVNESIALSIISHASRKHKLLESVKEKMKVVEAMDLNANKVQEIQNKYRSAYKAHVDARISEMQHEISNIIEATRNPDANFEDFYDEIMSLYRTSNELSTIRQALFH